MVGLFNPESRGKVRKPTAPTARPDVPTSHACKRLKRQSIQNAESAIRTKDAESEIQTQNAESEIQTQNAESAIQIQNAESAIQIQNAESAIEIQNAESADVAQLQGARCAGMVTPCQASGNAADGPQLRFSDAGEFADLGLKTHVVGLEPSIFVAQKRVLGTFFG